MLLPKALCEVPAWGGGLEGRGPPPPPERATETLGVPVVRVPGWLLSGASRISPGSRQEEAQLLEALSQVAAAQTLPPRASTDRQAPLPAGCRPSRCQAPGTWCPILSTAVWN